MNACAVGRAQCGVVGLALGILAGPLGAQTSLSIYRDGRVVVRRSLPEALQRGRNVVTLRLDGVDLATLFSPESSVTVVTATVRPPTDRAAALAAAVGQTLSFVRGKADTVTASVVRVDPPQYRLPDGRFLLAQPGEPLFASSLVRSDPEVVVTLQASRARPRTDLAYVTRGAGWRAVYQALLAGGRATVSGTVTVLSESLAVDSAEVQLVAGSIEAAAEPAGRPSRAVFLEAVVAAPAEAAEQAVGETHVYQLPGVHTLRPRVPVSVALFPRTGAPSVQEFVVPGALPWRGHFGAQPNEPNVVPVQVWYTFRRGRGTSFGDRPLPAGVMQIYEADSAGRLQLVGEAFVGHTPAGKDVRVRSGEAFDLTAERVQTDYNQEALPPPRRGVPARQRSTASYRVTLTNAKPEAVTVDVRETRAGAWRIVESSVPAEKLSATEVRFRLSVPGGGQAVLTYTVQAES